MQMHDDEVITDAKLVRRLIAAQFPHWAELPVERVSSAGTNNAIYRLGRDMAVRLPRIEDAVEQVEFEYGCLASSRTCRSRYRSRLPWG